MIFMRILLGVKMAERIYRSQSDKSVQFFTAARCRACASRFTAARPRPPASHCGYQKRYFRANCMIRGSLAEVTFPNWLLFKSTVGSIMLNLLVRLNASARNSTRCISRIWNVLESDRSNCQKPGPFTLPNPAFPNVPNAGCANAAALRKCPGVPSPYGFASTWLTRWPVLIVEAVAPPALAAPTAGRKVLVSDLSRLVTILIASPLKILRMGEKRQLDAIVRVNWLPNPGAIATADMLKTW